jgi:hypothetical protein
MGLTSCRHGLTKSEAAIVRETPPKVKPLLRRSTAARDAERQTGIVSASCGWPFRRFTDDDTNCMVLLHGVSARGARSHHSVRSFSPMAVAGELLA